MGCNYSMTDPCLTPDICNGHGRCVWDDTISIYYHARCECEPGWQAALNCKFPHNPRFCHISSATCGDFGTCSYVMGGNGNSTDPNDFRPVDYICTCDGSELITSAMLSILGEREQPHWLWPRSHMPCRVFYDSSLDHTY